jgi:hypothetical protein
VLQNLAYDVFAKLVNQKFSLIHDSGRLDVELIECKTLNAQVRDGHREPFSLIFRGPAQPLLPQRIYSFDFGELGRSDIFIVPIGRDAIGMRYEAVFN